MTSITYLLIKLINKQQKIIRKLKEMILQLSDIQGWADTLNADAVAITSKIQLLLAQIAEKDATIAQQALEIEQLNNTLADLTIENASTIINPALANIHAQGQ